MNKAYTEVEADFDIPASGGGASGIEDYVGTITYDGTGNWSLTATVNYGGIIDPGYPATGTHAVTTTNVLPDTAATTTSINGNYTLVDLSAQLSNGNIYGYEATITLTNGTISGMFTENNAGTITTGNPATGQWSVTNGVVTSVGAASGAVSADGDLIVLADTNSGDDPYINVAVLRGTATEPLASPRPKNANGTIMAASTGTGTYTVAADGTLTITDAEGDVYNGAISADGNALVLASVASQQNPAIFVGVRQ